MKKIKRRFLVVILPVLAILLAACGSMSNSAAQTPLPPALPLLNADEIVSKDDVCSNLIQAETKAWQSKDPEKMRDVYTDDVIHYDGGPAFIGIEEVIKMAKNMWIIFDDWVMRAGEAYISSDICFGEWENWNIFNITVDDPAVEYDWLEFRDDKVYFWRLFYDQQFQQAFNAPERIDEGFLRQFAAFWSNQGPDEIASLYSADAHLEDSLFGVDLNGNEEITGFAASFQAQFPDAAWRLIDPFAEEPAGPSYKEEYPHTYQGGVFAIELPAEDAETCEIRVIFLLAPDGNGKIMSQKTFYEADSLLDCGLAK